MPLALRAPLELLCADSNVLQAKTFPDIAPWQGQRGHARLHVPAALMDHSAGV